VVWEDGGDGNILASYPITFWVTPKKPERDSDSGASWTKPSVQVPFRGWSELRPLDKCGPPAMNWGMP